jgi:hypothetical protein
MKIPEMKEFDEFMKDSLVEIILKNDLLKSRPINSTFITRFFYKDICNVDPFKPSIHLYLKCVGMHLDDYLNSLQKNESFLAKLATKSGLTIEEFK